MNLRKWREAIRDDVELSAASKAVAFIIGTYAEHDGATASPGQVLIAENLGWTTRHVARQTAILVKSGYVTKDHIGHSAGPLLPGCGFNSIYTLHLPKQAAS